MPKELFDRFEAEADDGTVFVVLGYQTIQEVRLLSGAVKHARGAKEYVLSDGRHLNPVKDDPEAFQIFDSDEIIRKIG